MSKQNEVPDLKGLSAAAPAVAADAAPKVQTPPGMLTPEAQAYANALVTEAVRNIFLQMGPLLQSIALTPEKLAQAEALRRAPDPAAVARELRERQLYNQELAEAEANKQRVQANCPHTYPSGQAAWHIVRNYPDRQIRGLCPLCQLLVTPREWRIGAPTLAEPRGVPYVAEAHHLYKDVLKSLASKGV